MCYIAYDLRVPVAYLLVDISMSNISLIANTPATFKLLVIPESLHFTLLAQ